MSGAQAWVCDMCFTVIRDVYDRFERRIEFRTLTKRQGRAAVLMTGRRCRVCMDKEVNTHRPPKDYGHQGTMFDGT